MPESFGARLRRTREEQQIALVTIAQQTKIKLSLLEGLERDDVSHWPSGIFRRAYIRAYAQSIGLNPDEVVREFTDVHPEPEEVFEAALATALGADASRAGGGSRLKSMFGSALGSLSRLAGAPPPSEPRPAAEKRAPGMTARPVEDVFTFGIHPPIAMPRLEMADDAGVEIGSHTESQLPPSMVDGERMEAAFAHDIHLDEEEIDEDSRPSAPPSGAAHVATASGADDIVARREEPAKILGHYPDLLALAHLVTELGRVDRVEDLNALLELSAGTLRARGLIVWVWDEATARLRPGAAYGYSDRVLAQLPALRANADNATAAAFRSRQTCAIPGNEGDAGALVVPLLAASGCVGVLALELEPEIELTEWRQAVSTILSAMLAQLVERSRAAEVPTDVDLAAPMLRAGAAAR